MIFCLLCAVASQRQSIVDGMRTIALKIEFGAFHNQTFEKYIYVPVYNSRILHLVV